MTPKAKRTYRGFAAFFLIGGAVFVVLGIARAAFALDLVQGDPIPVALALMTIGGLLRWTARDRPDDPEDEEDGAGGSERAEGAPHGAPPGAPYDVPDDDAR